MADDISKQSGKSQAGKPVEEEATPVEVEVRQFDERIKNVERVVDMVKGISDKAFELGTEYLIKRTEYDQRQQELDDSQHKRSVYLLVFAITVVFVLCMTALLEKQVDLVRLFINSGLAAAAGMGVTSLLKIGGRGKKKHDAS